MGSRLNTPLALVTEMLGNSKHWSQAPADGELQPTRKGGALQFRFHAFWHTCPRCLQHTTAAYSSATRCLSCDLVSENSYRFVIIEIPESHLQTPSDSNGTLARFGAVLNHLSAIDPATLPHEKTLIELTRWKEFLDGFRWPELEP